MHEDFPQHQEPQTAFFPTPPDVAEGLILTDIDYATQHTDPTVVIDSAAEGVTDTSDSLSVSAHAGSAVLGAVEATQIEAFECNEDQEMTRLVERTISDMHAPGLHKWNQLMREALGTTSVPPETARRFWQKFNNHPSVFLTGSGFCTHKIVPSHLPQKVIDRFWEMDRAANEIMDHFFDKYLDKPFPQGYLVDYAKEIRVWPYDQDERDTFIRLIMHHPRNRPLPDEGLSVICEPGIKPYQREELSLSKRVELLYRTRREAVLAPMRWIAHHVYNRRDELTQDEVNALREAVEQCPHFIPIDGYPAWEIIPQGGSRHELDAAKAMAETIVRQLDAVGSSGDFDTNFLLEVAKRLGYDDSTKRHTSMLIMYLRAHPRIEWRDGLLWLHDKEGVSRTSLLPSRPELNDDVGKRFRQRRR